MIETEFDREAVEDLAEKLNDQVIGKPKQPQLPPGLQGLIEGNQSQNKDPNLLRLIGETSNKHNIPPEDRIDYACDAARLAIRQEEDEAVKEFRMNLRDLGAMFGL